MTAEEEAAGCVHRLFEEQVKRTPDAEALAFEGDRLTYAELNEQADRLAHHLRRLGVCPESLVGLLAERSPAAIVGVLGVLKAGGAYVPLDPGYPAERLRFLWEDSGGSLQTGRSPLLLAPRHLAGLLPAREVVSLDADAAWRAGPAHGDSGDRAGGAGPDNLAYVIYTSGSTGQPKGVLVPHRGVVNVIRETVRTFRPGPGDRVLQLATLGFDASVLEIFTAFASGACLVLTRRETLLSGEALGRELRERGITLIAIPPSLLDGVAEPELPALRSIIVGGEACSAATAARWAPGRRLVNAYAPTEATIYATSALCAGDGEAAPPIGRPIAGLRVRLLDENGEPVPAAAAGELCLGGVGVVRGYHNRPGLTAERFVPDRSGPPGSRLYRSGDLARALPDGDLLFAGRVDTQVKIRGLRIELGEIEAVLGQIPEVQTAAVLARDDGGGKRLVAYVVRRGGPGGAAGVSTLREALARRLPEAMVPAVFVFLDAMPMTPTAKVDRKALPAPDRARPELDTAFVAPATPLERKLAEIWGELLGLDQIGARDNFFALGGHSLLAGQVITRVREELGMDLPLRDVFDHPTIAGLAALAGRLGDPAAADGAAPPAERLPPIERAPRDQHGRYQDQIPLSFAQERVWFLNQLAPGAIAYNFQFTIRFTGALEPATLRRALSELVRRHEVLRTSFPEAGGQPVQVIHPPFAVEVPIVDLSGLPAGARLACAERLVQAEIRKGFDLSRIPLLRWLLMRLDERDHLLLQVEHHFVHDGWSLAVYLRELKELYTAFHAGLPSPLPEPPVQYADFALWQRRWMQGEVLAGQLAYWKETLGGSPPPLELPTDRPRPRRLSFRGGGLRVDLPSHLYAQIRAFSRREGSTLFMTMLAAFDALLYRYTGQGDVLLGSGIANRRLRELEEMVGMVVNTLVFRTALAGDLAFRGLLARVRATTLAAHDHQDMPFEKLVEELQPDRDPSRNPLFQVLFSFHDAPVPDLDFAGLSGDLFERHNGSAKSDLNVVVKPLAEQRVGRRPSAGGEALTMVWEYSGDLFEPATIDRLWGHYQVLLAGIAADGGQRVSELPLLTPAERQQLDGWSRPADDVRPAGPVHELVFAQAARAPGALAVAGGGERMSYGELAGRAEALAVRLRTLGVGAEDLVAVCTERSPEAVVAALGVLAAGAAYLPLDPAYPRDRLEYMLADSGAKALVVRHGLEAVLPEPDVPVLVIQSSVAEEAGASLPFSADLRRLAYVIYTSGSTGRPKGVEIEHGGLAGLVAWHLGAYGVTADDRATLIAGPGFDAAVWELWPYLAAGASLHIPDAETRSSPQRLLRWLAGERITLCFLPTPLAEALLDCEPPAGMALRAVLTGGDRLRRLPDPGLPFVLINHYGPTENSVVTTAGPVGESSARAETLPSIGRPIRGTQVHLLDRGLHRVPAGVPGELCAAGGGLARGYRERPELTAEKLVPDPWSEPPGGRLYRTGDLARWLPDGRIEFLGRIDSQVKIRGFRIELGEIEAVLGEHPEVRQAVVVARLGGGLAAYVVPAGSAAEPDAETLGAFLATRMPDYMVPATFTALAALPLTANGKVDLAALPEPATGRASDARRVAPRTPLEELLAGVWGAALGVPAVGVHDDFFKLGGHSLIATRMLSRVRDAVQAEVPLAALFEGPTVAELAVAVEHALAGPAAAGRIPRRAPGATVPLSFAQERLWFLDQLAPGGSAYNIARAFAVRGALDPGVLARAVAAIVRRHESLRTAFPDVDGKPVQEVSAAPERPHPLPVADLSVCPPAAREAEVERILQAEARRPFDLHQGPLLRLCVLRTSGREHLLVLVMHHIVSDGWSMGVFFRELSALCRGAASLPELPVQYPDFAVWQRERLRGKELSGLLAWWREQLGAAPPRLELPADRPRPAVQTFRGRQEALPLPPATAEALRELARGSAATPFILLLAALAALFGRLTGQTDLPLGAPIAGRTRSETEGLIGFFVNTLVLRLRWDGDPVFRDLLSAARRVTLAAHARQEVPFEKLVAELQPDRSLAHTPLFQVLFAFQGATDDAFELPGAQVAAREIRRDESRFDLEIVALESAAGPGEEAASGLSILWRYDSDLFDRVTVLRMARNLETLLSGLSMAPERRLSELPLLSAAEAHQVLVDWNDTAAAGDPEATLVALFAAQAARTPGAVALIAADRELTYGELDGRAEGVARRLRAAGVGPEAPVGVLLEREPDLVAALLGVLKAGGFYVPLDPAYPAARLAFMLEDSGARTVLTQERLLEKVPAVAGRLRAICLDRPIGHDPEGAAGAAGPAAGPDNLAYLIYTSGSTGRPKGVAIAHRSAAALVRWARGVFPPADLEGVLAATSVCFDLSVFELFVPLSCGGAVVLAENALELPTLRAARRVTLVNTVPSAMTELLRLEGIPASVRTVSLAGEPLTTALVEQIYRSTGARRVFDLYGPSEDTTYSTCAARGADSPATIGRPIAGARVYLLDAFGRPAPVGAAGELCLAGDGLARGYLGRPELTAEKFAPDPSARGERLYRTGDLARWRPDGSLEFLGRIDHQVKIRGFRIELGEVEEQLLRRAGVREVVAVAREDRPGEKRLVAYVAAGAGTEAADLAAWLGERLPAHMVPSDFVLLAALPRTPNGKVDRKALPRPEPGLAGGGEGFVAPESPEERSLAAIWCEVLGLETVGIQDDFFRLGGHSLLAAQVIARLRRDFQVDLPLRSLFQAPTIAGLLSLVRQARETADGTAPAAMPRIGRAARTARVSPSAETRPRSAPGDGAS